VARVRRKPAWVSRESSICQSASDIKTVCDIPFTMHSLKHSPHQTTTVICNAHFIAVIATVLHLFRYDRKLQPSCDYRDIHRHA
jgi:hypothetical protein